MKVDLSTLTALDRICLTKQAGIELGRLIFAECEELRLLTPEKVVGLLECDFRTLVRRGLPVIKISPKTVRVRKIDLDAFIAAGSQKRKPQTRRRHVTP